MVESKKKYGYVLESTFCGEPYTREGFGECVATNHAAVLTALNEALHRLNIRAKVFIHTESAFVNNMISGRLKEWAEKGYKNAKGEMIKNWELWIDIGDKMKGVEFRTLTGEHSYSQWLKREMEKLDD